MQKLHVPYLRPKWPKLIPSVYYQNRAHSASFLLGIVDIYQFNTFQIANFMYYYHNNLIIVLFLLLNDSLHSTGVDPGIPERGPGIVHLLTFDTIGSVWGGIEPCPPEIVSNCNILNAIPSIFFYFSTRENNSTWLKGKAVAILICRFSAYPINQAM